MPGLSEIINQTEFLQETHRQIADILTEYNFGYLQNQPLVMDIGKEYEVNKPAFWLPQDSNTIIDITADQNTAENLKTLYSKNNFDSIIVTPQYTASPIWQYSFLEEIASYTNPLAYDMLPVEYR